MRIESPDSSFQLPSFTVLDMSPLIPAMTITLRR